MPTNGLLKTSQIMEDKLMPVRRDRIGPAFGQVDGETMLAVTRSVAVFLGIA